MTLIRHAATLARFNASLFGQTVYNHCKENKISAAKLSRLTGISASTIGRVTYGKPPDVETLCSLLKFLDKSLDEFVIDATVIV